MLKISSNSGNFTVLFSVIGAAGVSLFVLSSNIAKTNQKAKAIGVEKAVIDAEQINRSAITYLNTTLEQDGTSGQSPLKVVDNKIVGKSVGFIEIAKDTVSYYSINPKKMASLTLKTAMEGSEPQPDLNNRIKTQLEILDTIPQPDNEIWYDVRAKTKIQETDTGDSPRSISTVARIKIHSYLTEIDTCTSKGGSFKNEICIGEPPPAVECSLATNVALVIDASGSMEGTKWKEAVAGVDAVLGKLKLTKGPTGLAHVIIFNTLVKNYGKLIGTTPPQTISQIDTLLGKVKLGGIGHTEIQPGIQLALDTLKDAPGPKVMIVLTDGVQPSRVKDPVKYANKYVKPLGIKIISVGYGNPSNRSQNQPRVMGLANSPEDYINAYSKGTDQIEEAFINALGKFPCPG
ncbi:MAG: VWA domain-containing protein [Proteobacteria bacterium]|nr:VWA domain-containing protein [Pseudomonadota bacterium]